MAVISPSKYSSLAYLEQCKQDNFISSAGKEYCAEELESLLLAKWQNKADAMLDSWTKQELFNNANTGATNEREQMITYKETEAAKTDTDIKLEAMQNAQEAANKIMADVQKQAEALMRGFHVDLQVKTGEALDRSISYADKLSQDMIARVTSQLGAVARPRVMVVEEMQIQRKLTKAATAYLPRLMVNAKLGLNSLLIGPAGMGKTTAAMQVAEAMGLPFHYVNLTAGASETWLFGRQTPNGFVEGPLSIAYRNGGVFLADEFDAADANLALAINTAIEQNAKSLFNPNTGEAVPRHEKFIFIAAANTVGKGADGVYTGRNRLDGATLTRFVKILVDYSEDIEMAVCPDEALRTQLQNARKKIRSVQSDEIISTRCLEACYLQKKAGIPVLDIFASLTVGWPVELIKQCGLDSEAGLLLEEKPAKKRSARKEDLIQDGENSPF